MDELHLYALYRRLRTISPTDVTRPSTPPPPLLLSTAPPRRCASASLEHQKSQCIPTGICLRYRADVRLLSPDVCLAGIQLDLPASGSVLFATRLCYETKELAEKAHRAYSRADTDTAILCADISAVQFMISAQVDNRWVRITSDSIVKKEAAWSVLCVAVLPLMDHLFSPLPDRMWTLGPVLPWRLPPTVESLERCMDAGCSPYLYDNHLKATMSQFNAVLFAATVVKNKSHRRCIRQATATYRLVIGHDDVYEHVRRHHGATCWLSDGMERLMRASKHVVTVALVDRTTDEVVAGEVGYLKGRAYMSMTGFHRRSGAGRAQILLLATHLATEHGIDSMNMTQPMVYKTQLGCLNYPLHAYKEYWLSRIRFDDII